MALVGDPVDDGASGKACKQSSVNREMGEIAILLKRLDDGIANLWTQYEPVIRMDQEKTAEAPADASGDADKSPAMESPLTVALNKVVRHLRYACNQIDNLAERCEV